MTHIADDLYMGGFSTAGWPPKTTAAENPTSQPGMGPMGRTAHLNIVPATLGTDLIAALQAPTAATALTLTAGAGVTAGTAPDGSGRAVMTLDVPRAVSLTSASNLSAINFTIVGFDLFGRLTTQTRAGPNANTVNTLKAFASVLSVTPSGTSVNTVSIGTSDIFGLPWLIADAGYITHVGWANVLARNAGTFVVGDATDPATAATGDPRGTYLPTSASNGARRLVIAAHLIGAQVGSSATITGAIGVAPV